MAFRRLAAAAMLALAFLPAAGARAQPAADRPVPVIVAPVVMQPDDVVVRAVGSGQARQTVAIFPRAAGDVTRVAFSAGDRVAAGQLLLQLDDEEERLAVRLAQVRIESARVALQRYERAGPGGAVAASEIDQARSALDEARVQLAQAELALSRRRLLAPFAGVVGIPKVDPGERVGTTTEIATLDDLSRLLLDFDVAEAYAGRIAVGDPVEAVTWVWPGESFRGTVAALESRIDPATRTLRVRAVLENEQGRLKSGMSFAVSLRLPGRPYASVPEIAVQFDREGAHVWLVRDGAARRADVLVRQRRDGRALLEGALDEGERVVVEGVLRLREGRRVQAIEGGAAPAAAGTARGS